MAGRTSDDLLQEAYEELGKAEEALGDLAKENARLLELLRDADALCAEQSVEVAAARRVRNELDEARAHIAKLSSGEAEKAREKVRLLNIEIGGLERELWTAKDRLFSHLYPRRHVITDKYERLLSRYLGTGPWRWRGRRLYWSWAS